MNFTKFKHYMEVLKIQNEKEFKFGIAMEEFLDGAYVPCFSDTLTGAYIELLEDYFEDEGTISWWLYEWEEGSKEELSVYGMFVREVPVPMKTMENLYTYLMWCKTMTPEDKWDGIFTVEFE